MSAADDLETRWQTVEDTYPVEAWVDIDDQRQLDLLFGPGVRRVAETVNPHAAAGRRLPPEQREALVARWRTGEFRSLSAAARTYGVHITSVRDLLKRRGL